MQYTYETELSADGSKPRWRQNRLESIGSIQTPALVQQVIPAAAVVTRAVSSVVNSVVSSVVSVMSARASVQRVLTHRA